jgi:PAS domain S-box-containing protein
MTDDLFIQGADRAERELEMLLALSESLASSPDLEGTLHSIARMLASVLGSDRCSVLVLDDDRAIVVADSEDPAVRPVELLLSQYPEVRETVRRLEPVIVDDVRVHHLFDEVRAQIADKPVGSTILFPVLVNQKVQGILHLRTRRQRRSPLRPDELRFGRIVANATGLALRSVQLVESIRSRSQRVLSERIQVERKLRQIEKYERFFDLAGDGLMIIDGTGQILFANRAAQGLLGFGASAICTVRLADLVAEGGQGALRELMDDVLLGPRRRMWELPLVKASGQVALFSLTTAGLDPDAPEVEPPQAPRPAREATAIVSFRDVTETRATEEQLRRTANFLSNIIASSADAIVVAGTDGRIVIFNEVAAQITGYTEAEAMRMHVSALYPEGEAQRIMAALRSPHHGGVGKLEERREVLKTKEGDEIPVNLAAAIVMDQGKEIATVGIFSDLRERLRMEANLRAAEQKAAAVETAGAAAHELNQPLTSIIGSVELLTRKVPDGSPARPYLDTILREAERMALIVKKLGQITRYRTKPYLGTTDILDLDAASQGGGDAP